MNDFRIRPDSCGSLDAASNDGSFQDGMNEHINGRKANIADSPLHLRQNLGLAGFLCLADGG